MSQNAKTSKSKLKSGRVIRAVTSRFIVDTGDKTYLCFARKKLKGGYGDELCYNDIFVGDIVDFQRENDSFVIEAVHTRKNVMVRPYVANIDVCLIVVAPVPSPDFMLVDKVIVNCLEQGIVPMIVANKIDAGVIDALDEYENVCTIFHTSAETGEGLKDLYDAVQGKTVCFAGQSAVGKSSILNALVDNNVQEVGEIASKVKRGRHTTRTTEIFNLGGDTYLVDTCGFSMLDAIDVAPENLRFYFDEMEKFRPMCRFNSCTHTDEPDCAVKAHIGNGVSKGRYERYKAILNELTIRREKKYE